MIDPKTFKSGGYSVAKRLLSNKRYDAKRKGIEFNITLDDLTFPTHCPVLGIELDYTLGEKKHAQPNSPSIDRRNPEEGYVPGNVIVISHRANLIKQDASADELRRVADFFLALEGGQT